VRCFFKASFSSCVRGYIRPLMEDGAFGFRSIAWFHGRSGGNLCAWVSENTLRCRRYSCGIVLNSSGGML